MKVAVVSGSRADYGLLRPTIEALRADAQFEPELLVTAMHLQARYGDTINEIEADGVPIAARVPAGDDDAAGGGFGRNLGRATIAFTDVLASHAPDLVLVLGDRFEILAAALAATGLGIPIAHLHGGELSEGSLDDATRHCVTKLAHLHLVAAPEYAERVLQLGEEPWRIHVVGAAGLESIHALKLIDRDALARALALPDLDSPLISLTLHAASLTPATAQAQADAVTGAVDDAVGDTGTVIVTLPNDDPGSDVVRGRLARWSAQRDRVHTYDSLGQLRYLSLLSHADAVIGNSSSALLEAPAFAVPVVNVGDRQRGRIQPANVISVPAERAAVAQALTTALTPAFRESLAGMENPYGDGQVSRRVLEILRSAPESARLRAKRFVDLPDGEWRGRATVAEDR